MGRVWPGAQEEKRGDEVISREGVPPSFSRAFAVWVQMIRTARARVVRRGRPNQPCWVAWTDASTSMQRAGSLLVQMGSDVD